jgi:hypothetical protein
MPNYTLTTDLIADCMALIPQYLELLNTSQNEFEFGYDIFTDKIGMATKLYDTNSDIWKFHAFSHCLRNIPEFQAENKNFKAMESVCQSTTGIFRTMNLSVLSQTPKTIAAATLHGQGEFPPSTLEELCESYENVMSK